ncbi:hypothetical protein ACS0TY_005308 [Phlomoides rotata]
MERSEESIANDISSLPGSIIDGILARLPLRDAVRTSVLSREWRYKWKSVPKLVFDFQVGSMYLRNSKMEDVVYQVLRHHRGPINKFSLSCRTSPDIDQWILLLTSSEVQDFTLSIFWGDKHGMPSHFYAFQNLKHLYLYKCIFRPPPEFKGFSKLATLDFQDVDYIPAIFEQFISQSPLLESLRLVGCTELDAFEIHGPSLRFFTFHGVFKTIRFKNSPVLAEVSLSVPIVQSPGVRSSAVFEYFHIPPMLKKLHLHPCVLEFLGAGGVQSRFADSFNCLKVLNLSMYLDRIKEVASALCLARSSPGLQMLRVSLYTGGFDQAVIDFIRAQETPDPYLHQLRRVVISLFSGSEPEIELLRYLLASAAGLEEMVIAPFSSSLLDDARLMNRLKQFPRASPAALVYVKGRELCIIFPFLERLVLFFLVFSTKWTAQARLKKGKEGEKMPQLDWVSRFCSLLFSIITEYKQANGR